MGWVAGGPLQVEEALGRVGAVRFHGVPVAGTRLRSAALTLTATAPAATLLEVYARAGFLAIPWGPGALPRLVGEFRVASDFLAARALLAAGGPFPVTLPLDLPALDSARFSQGEAGGFPQWDGQFSLHLHARTTSGVGVTIAAGASLVVAYDRKEFSGNDVSEERYYSAQSRFGICPVTGDEALREDFSWCEFHRRFELPSQCDPDDRPEPVRSNPRLINER